MKSKFVFTALFFLVFCVSAYGVQVSVPEISAAPGDMITIGISVDDATGIAGGDIELEYDTAILEAKEARATDLVKSLGPLTNTTIAGKVKFAMASISGLTGGSGVMFEIDFSVKAGASGTSPLTLSDVALFDAMGNDIAVTSVNGSVKVQAPVQQSKVLSITDADVNTGDVFTTSVKINDVAGVAGGDLVLLYDQSILSVEDVKTTALLAGMSAIINKDVAGRITVSLAGTTGAQAGTGSILDISFKAKEGLTQDAEVQLTFESAELYDENAGSIPVEIGAGGVIKVKGAPPSAPRVLTIADASGKAGEVIATAVLIDDVTGVAGADIILQYDPGILSVESVAAANLLAGMSIIANTDVAGKIIVSVAGTTGAQAGTGAILNISFRAKADLTENVTVDVTFESADLYDENAATIPVKIGAGGTISVEGAPPPAPRVLTIADASGKAGESISTAVQIDNVTGVAGADIVLLYGSNVLSVESVTAGALLAGMSVIANTDVAGKITVSVAGTTGAQAGTGAILNVSFKARADLTEDAEVDVTIQSAELYDENAKNIPVEIGAGGKISVKHIPPLPPKALTIADASGKAGETINTSVQIGDLTGVAGADIVILYDPAFLSVTEVKTTDLLAGMSAIVNADVAGKINVSVAGTTGAQAGAGAIINISFKAKEGVAGETELTFESAQLYDENANEITVESYGGKVKIGFDTTATGTLIKLEVTAFQYGTHGLLVNNKLAYALQSSTLDLDQFVDKDVTVVGSVVHLGLDGGPPLLNVASLEVLKRVVKEHTDGEPMLALQATYNEANVHGHTYIDVWSGSIPVQTGQFLEFQVAMFSGNPAFQGSVDLHASDGSTLRDSGAKDQNDIGAHPGTDLSGYARDQWYHRKISLDALAGKTLDGVMIATDSDQHRAGVFRLYVDNIQITDGEHVITYIWGDEATEGKIPITGTTTATGTAFAGTAGMSNYSVTITGATPVTPAEKLMKTWGYLKKLH